MNWSKIMKYYTHLSIYHDKKIDDHNLQRITYRRNFLTSLINNNKNSPIKSISFVSTYEAADILLTARI